MLPEGLELNPDDTLTQGLVTNNLGFVNFKDPCVDSSGQCSVRRGELDVFDDGKLILPEFLCGSPEFAVLRSDASFEVVRDVIRSEQLPEAIFFAKTFDCTPMGTAETDLQRRGVFAWQPDDRATVAEGRVLELTNGCGSSRGATRALSWFVLNLHIDCNIPFGSNHPGVLQCFIDLTNDKFAVLDQSLKNAKKSLLSPKYGKLRSQLSSAKDGFEDGNYTKALERLAKFISRVEAAEFDTSSGFNFQGNLLMRAENIEFIIDEKIILAP